MFLSITLSKRLSSWVYFPIPPEDEKIIYDLLRGGKDE